MMRSAAVAGVAAAALAAPAGAGAHAAYVDAEGDASPSDQCSLPDDPCQTISQAAPFVEDGLAVFVDDSVSPYMESVIADGHPSGDDIAIVALDFRPEPGPAGTFVIDGGAGTAVTVPAAHGATISGFGLRGDASAVTVNGRATISNNTFDDAGSTDDVLVQGPGPSSISNNTFTGASTPGDTAIELAGGSGPASLSRNTVSGYAAGIDVGDVSGAVTMGSDLLTANTTALDAGDDVTVENATFWNNGTDISSTDGRLALDSTIVEDEIVTTGTATCDIVFSRGPSSNPCDGFQTDAAPMFVNPVSNFHLQAGSPMIDAGNPATPGVFRDIDEDLRALDGNGDGACPVERDIGADEFTGAILDCSPPPGPQPQPQPQPQPGDSAPPETVVEGGPSRRTKSKAASFRFSSSEAGSSFECRLDGGAFRQCASPHDAKVKPGKHVFEARAIDAAGNVDATPASWRWTVKKRKRR